MADRSTQLILDGLRRAVAEPTGLPLFTQKTAAGLFANTAPARQAAQRCKDDGLIRVVRQESHGRSVREVCAITEKGLSQLLEQVSPRQVLEDLVKALEGRKLQVGELVAAARNWEAGLETLRTTAERILQQLQCGGARAIPAMHEVGAGTTTNGHETWLGAIVSYLIRWRDARATEDCPLPELYRHALMCVATLSIGRFHDGLRHLYEQQQIYLHPWTGPLYDLPEPQIALLVGHEIAYYASKR